VRAHVFIQIPIEPASGHEAPNPLQKLTHHSLRSATMGFTDAARLAGTTAAHTADSTSMVVATT
jgi:hypothetical protein